MNDLDTTFDYVYKKICDIQVFFLILICAYGYMWYMWQIIYKIYW